MSGGVDSSVAAALLVEAGYDVTGAYMVNYEEKGREKREEGSNSTCWVPDYRDATRVAAKLGIPLLKLDFQKEYKEGVLGYMYAEYKKGRTPNPDVMCNKIVKFGAWLDRIRELGFDMIATGHYARIVDGSLFVAKDENKDQTYFLHQLDQEQLAHTMFPLGEYTKNEVRGLAKKFYLPTAEKEESMGICFVGEVSMKEFLQRKIKPTPGNIVLSPHASVGTGLDLAVLGEHEGLAFYTIGQRNIGVGSVAGKEGSGDNKPLFVVDKKFDSNELVVGYEDDELLWKREIDVEDMHWIRGQKPNFPLQCKVRMRHRQELQVAQIQNSKFKMLNQLTIEFEEKQKAVTPGQFVVLYKDGECLGGGVIR